MTAAAADAREHRGLRPARLIRSQPRLHSLLTEESPHEAVADLRTLIPSVWYHGWRIHTEAHITSP